MLSVPRSSALPRIARLQAGAGPHPNVTIALAGKVDAVCAVAQWRSGQAGNESTPRREQLPRTWEIFISLITR